MSYPVRIFVVGVLALLTPNVQAQLVTAQTPTVLPKDTPSSALSILSAPPQDKGLPYTRSAQKRALSALKNTIALCAGGRYAYVYGYKVRLDTLDILRGEAFRQNDKLFVPEAAAGLAQLNQFTPKPMPAGLNLLADRWVYDLPRTAIKLPPSVERRKVGNQTYIALTDYARHLGRQVKQTPRGLLLIGTGPIGYDEAKDPVLADAIISLFDTPEKYIEPQLATRYIPFLNKQGDVTKHARITPAQLADLDGPEPTWPEPPRSSYDLTGFNAQLLGSVVPAPGVYPRLLFSPQDIPMLQAHIRANKVTQKALIEMEVLFAKSWLNPQSSDGKVFEQLASGALDTKAVVTGNAGPAAYHVAALTNDHKPGIFNTHINYVSNCLTTMALYCLLTDNKTLGRKVANAICSYYRLVEPKVDEHLRTSDSEFGTSPDNAGHSVHQWRGMHTVVPHMDLAFSLDFAGAFMTDTQRRFMQQLIAKATYGRRTNGGDGPRRAWRDINHVTWHLTHHICQATIEGLDGFDPEGYASGSELTRDFLTWGIDEDGFAFESNGKSGGGLQFQILAMIVQARRGDNLWGHPHWRKFLTGQAYMTAPNGRETVTSGTWGGSPLSAQAISEIKAFYPNDRAADWLLSTQYPNLDWATFDLAAYRKQIELNSDRLRLPGPTYPGFVLGFPYAADWKPTRRSDLALDNSWKTDTYGYLSATSDSTADASWMALHARANHYIGSGHHHADLGMFYFSGLGVNWFTESPFPKTYTGKNHNLVIIDGKAEADGPPAGVQYLGVQTSPQVSFGSIDQTYAYTWQWCTQVMDWGTGFSRLDSAVARNGWELEPNPDLIRYFRGTKRYKMRPWWPTANFSNWTPTLRALWNPVQYVYRSAGLVRGTHPYGLVVDDARKDDQPHRYEWAAMLAKGVWQANVPNLPTGAVVLAHRSELEKGWAKPKPQAPLNPKAGDPLLLVYDLEANTPAVQTATDGPDEGKGPQPYNRLTFTRTADKARFRVLMLPFRAGEALPNISYQNNRAVIQWADQTDTLIFDDSTDNRTRITVNRNALTIGQSR
ncbi:hypothetical protein F5984_21755 [Rudanella paleaurantiibacter]|uniref:DUF4962 domain-containing protein n=1 Tax=Rudanella paleaurantiibacter TaxID=2614655 RepID=A0A7J5TTQ9_9BACT|nr:hypothetical protein [Rudanella paleaurantiibacter]KAB7727257.1 hypothetical protein F5984_21755 [Rudanella paleaurantiibacter]